MKVAGIAKTVSNDQPEDIGALWERFYTENIANKISNKISSNVIAAYTCYQGDHTQPYTMLIGYEVYELPQENDEISGIEFDTSQHTKYTVTGEMPTVVIEKWAEIWASDKARAYRTDYDIYQEDGSVDIYVEYAD